VFLLFETPYLKGVTGCFFFLKHPILKGLLGVSKRQKDKKKKELKNQKLFFNQVGPLPFRSHLATTPI